MDLRHLETFIKIAERKSFTKAAEELYRTQPTVSKQIVDLERYLEVKLIDRTKRNVALTKAGEILLKYAKDFLHLKKEAIDAIAAFKGLKKGSMLVGASNIPGIYMLPQVLNLFRNQYNGIQLKLVISDTKDITHRVEQGECDVGFVGAKDETKKLDYRKFLDDIIIMVAPREYPDSIHVKSLKDYPLIIREEGSGTRNSFELALKKSHVMRATDLKVAAELSDTEAIKEAVKNGMGISYISKMAVKEELLKGNLKYLHVEGFPDIKRSFYITTRKGRTQLPQVRALVEIADKWRRNVKA